MKDISGVLAGPLPALRAPLEKWIFVNNEYSKRWDWGDVPWWYLERASISTLAAAVWLAKGIALEEYTTSKTVPVEADDAATSKRCRCDLFVSIRNSKKESNYVVEAKMCWPLLSSKNLKKKIDSCLKSALADVRKNQPDGHRLGLAIVSPVLSSHHEDCIDDRIDDFVDELKSRTDCAVAWIFPKKTRKLKPKESGRIYPGAAILLKPLRAMN